VADVTFIGTCGEKRIPNPNVMIELGYALRAVSSSRVILLMNTAFGGPVLRNAPPRLAIRNRTVALVPHRQRTWRERCGTQGYRTTMQPFDCQVLASAAQPFRKLQGLAC
jgi:hypothetical protein